MKLDIHNGTQRVVICKNVRTGNYFPNGELLKQKQRYHISKIEVHSWYTDVYLKEFPEKNFNSVQFAEIFPQEIDIKNLVEANSYERKAIATFSENTIPSIILNNTTTIDLSLYKEEMMLLEVGEAFTIGKTADCEIQLQDESIYSLHCYISKTITGKYVLYDCSLNGTMVSL